MNVNTINNPNLIPVTVLAARFSRPIQWTRRYIKRKGYAEKISGRWYLSREKYLANSDCYDDPEDYTTGS